MSGRRSGDRHAQQRLSPNHYRREAGDRAELQALETPDVRLLMDKMLDDSKKRKQAKRQALKNDYARRAQKVSNDIKTAIDEYEEQRQAEQRQQITRLIELLKKRQNIEHRIQTSVQKFEAEYSARLEDFVAVVEGKVGGVQ